MKRLATAATVALLGSLLVAAHGAAGASSPVPKSLARVFGYQRPARYSSAKVQVYVPMRDGVRLWCNLYQPAVKGTATPARGRFPGIVNNLSPYFIAYPFDVFAGPYFAERGYLDLECTPRGTGLSGGLFPGWLSALENQDNYDLIEWLAHQPNSTGRIGQQGNSYGGMTAYRVASLHPPHLVAIAPQQSFASLYREYTYPGGIRSLGDPYWYGFAAATGVGRSAVSTQEAEWLAHPVLDAYWQQIDVETKWADIDIPVLGFGGWVDIFQDGMVRNYLGLRGPNTYLIDGPWPHSNTFDATVTRGVLLAWFDHWLSRDTRAPLPPTPVASYLMPYGPWQALADWPAPGATARTLGLTASSTMSGRPGAAGRHSFVQNTGAGVVDLPDDHLTFAAAPLKAGGVIAGAPSLRLVATLSDPTGAAAATASTPDTSPLVDANFMARLWDVSPAGDRRLVTRGYLKASHRNSHTYPARIPLGQQVTYEIPLWHVNYRLAAGHRLELTLASGDPDCCLSAAPAAAQPLLPLTVTVHTGAGGSKIALPVTRWR